jgi:hypothetical protein
MLQNVPPELITAIFEDLPQSDVASSATVSRVVGYVAERTLHSNVVVDHQTVEALAESFRTTCPERAAFIAIFLKFTQPIWQKTARDASTLKRHWSQVEHNAQVLDVFPLTSLPFSNL